MFYLCKVPPTNDQGNFEFIVSDVYTSKSADALSTYNSARGHDDQQSLKRMPAGTEYRPLYNYVVQQYTGSQYGWEAVSSFFIRANALECVKEYRENQPQYPARIRRYPMDREEAHYYYQNRHNLHDR